ncbi:hypothetical protein ES288_A05G087100v1 [Gossypium darwinii]|uniref:Uncharacterized protein n=2 Tax=Gossypium TaxID=3633 RepID=A0A5D2QCW9_GOSTO|nr:hypothetical protein ES288_A05G087100v1 [Gossypium darwinii]TYI26033.1 hypothetical protein ES332_A05G087900v1 [Gossypium tomentosum]
MILVQTDCSWISTHPITTKFNRLLCVIAPSSSLACLIASFTHS